MIYRKKAETEIGALLTWFVAFIAIFFIMLLYVGFTASLAAKKHLPIIGIGADEVILDSNGKAIDIKMQRDFEYFLNSPVEYDGGNMKMKDLISLEPEQEATRFEKFRDLSNNFLDDLKLDLKKNKKLWLRIYSLDEEVTLYDYRDVGGGITTFPLKYNKYFAYRNPFYGMSGVDSSPCNPKSENSVYLEYLIKNKKIVLCAEFY